MSYGERSCIKYAANSCQLQNGCNVDCLGYVSNGNKPDTKHKQSTIKAKPLFPKKRKFK